MFGILTYLLMYISNKIFLLDSDNLTNIMFYFLGLAGFLPQSPHAYKVAWRNREEIVYQEEHASNKSSTE